MAYGSDVGCSVVIVNYETDRVLERCLQSLQHATSRLEILVIDNSATLRKAGMPARFPGVRFYETPRNVGFAAACNLGLLHATGRYLTLLNPDTIVHEGAVRQLVEYLDSHPGVGAVGPKLLDPDGSLQYSCRRFPRYFTIFFGRYAFLTRVLPNNKASRHYLYLDLDREKASDVDWLSGACIMVRREVLETVGPLDEGYFLFVEDMDWCRRIHDAGWRVAYVPSAEVTHEIGASRGPVSPAIVWARHRGMLRYVRKHFRPSGAVEALLGAGLYLHAGVQVLSNSLRSAR